MTLTGTDTATDLPGLGLGVRGAGTGPLDGLAVCRQQPKGRASGCLAPPLLRLTLPVGVTSLRVTVNQDQGQADPGGNEALWRSAVGGPAPRWSLALAPWGPPLPPEPSSGGRRQKSGLAGRRLRELTTVLVSSGTSDPGRVPESASDSDSP